MHAAAFVAIRDLFGPNRQWIDLARLMGIPTYWFIDDNFMVLKELVSSSHVVSLAPWDVIAQDVASGRLAPLQISVALSQHSAYGIVSRAGHSLSPGAAQLRLILLAQDAAD